MIKKTVYSKSEKDYINVLNIARIVVEDDTTTDWGYFKVSALIYEDDTGWEGFKGEIDQCWTEDGLKEWAKTLKRNGRDCKVVTLGHLNTKPDRSLRYDEMWEKMWKNIKPRANKLARDIKAAQDAIINEKNEASININCY